MSKRDGEQQPPAVAVFYQQDLPQDAWQQLLYGLEEEGIPWLCQACPEGDADQLAFAAAAASRLAVGLGVSAAYLALHEQKLPAERPLFRIPATAAAAELRALGANAARLVKKLPFKQI